MAGGCGDACIVADLALVNTLAGSWAAVVISIYMRSFGIDLFQRSYPYVSESYFGTVVL